MAETQGAFAWEQWKSWAHSVYHLGQTGHIQLGHRKPVLSRLEVPLRRVGLLTYQEEVFADSLALDHCRRHTELEVLWNLAVHHNWTDDTLGRWAEAAQLAAQVELTG